MDNFNAKASIQEAHAPPASWYFEQRYQDIERYEIFSKQWLAVSRVNTLVEPGHFVSGCTAQEPWLIARQEDQSLKAFANVCRHNGTEVASGKGHCQEFVCPYHGWTYELDGRLKKAPQLGARDNFKRADHGLKEISVQPFGPLLLLNIQPGAPSPKLTELEQRLTAMSWQDLRYVKSQSYTLNCNWKVFVDNYLDGGYHVGHLHKNLASKIDLESYQTEIFDNFSIQSVSGGDINDMRLGSDALYAWVYPNLMINRYGPMLDINTVTPLTPTTCRVDFDWYFDKKCDNAFIEEAIGESQQVQDEDIAICESLQVGMGSSHYIPGPYAPKIEHAKYYFHQLLAADYDRGLGSKT